MPKARKSDSAKASSSSAAPRKSDAAPAAAQPLLAGYQPVSVGRHCIYLRAHDGGDGRTLFVVNLPSDTTERHLRHLFSAAGPVERVSFLGERPVAGSEELDEESEAEDEAMPAAAAEPSKGKGKAKKGYTKVVLNKAGPPAIVPLPPLDPRGVHRFHHTSTSAHVVFLDASSVARALALAPQKAWPEPWAQVEAAAVSLADLWRQFAAADERFAEVSARLGGGGARVLRQDPVECVFQFLCSSNNNIARIEKMVWTLAGYGERLGEVGGFVFHRFPTIERLARVSEQELREAGFGYRSALGAFLLCIPFGVSFSTTRRILFGFASFTS